MAQMTLALLARGPSLRIDPDRLLSMLLWGIVCGGGLGVLWDAFRITRVALGVSYPSRAADVLYARPLPILRRPVRRPSRRAGQRVVQQIVIVLEDLLFGISCGVVMTVLIYVTGDGVFRLMAPAGMLVGFFLYYHTLGRLVLAVSQGIVYLVRAAMCYAVALCLLPPRLLWWLWRQTVGALLVRAYQREKARRAVKYHEEKLRVLTARASRGWLCEERTLKKGGWYRVKSKTDQKNDDSLAQYADISCADRDLCHHLFCDQTDGEQQAAPGAGCTATADRRGKATGVGSAV